MSIQWEEPPPTKNGKGSRPSRLDSIREELQANPGRWALVYPDSKSRSMSTVIAQGNGKWGPPGAFDATSRRNTDGTYQIYVRCVGPA